MVENKNVEESDAKKEVENIAKRKTYYQQSTECIFCKILFKTIDELRKHDQENHMIENKFVCPDEFCTFKHNKKRSVQNHFYKRHHKMMSCEICSANFRTEKRLNIHVQSQHNGESGWICEMCSKECKNFQS